MINFSSKLTLNKIKLIKYFKRQSKNTIFLKIIYKKDKSNFFHLIENDSEYVVL